MHYKDLPNDSTGIFLRTAVQMRLVSEDMAVQAWEGAAHKRMSVPEYLVQEGLLTQVAADSILDRIFHPSEVPVIAGYRVLQKLGSGATATVYRARQLSIDREVALKLLSPHFLQHPKARQHFLAEARSAASVTHPNVVAIHDIGEDRKRLFIALEYVPGGDAASYAKREGGKLSDRTCLHLMGDMARALGAIHKVGMLHRDVKPSNILIDANGMAKLADLGLACPRQEGDDSSIEHAIVGTPSYMSPEQARGDPIDHRTDLFSLGATILDLATGHPPHAEKSPYLTVQAAAQGRAPDPAALKPHMSKSLARILRSLLQTDPNRRFPDASVLLGEIAAALETAPSIGHLASAGRSRPRIVVPELPSSSRTHKRKPRGSNRYVWVHWILISGILAIIGGIVFWLQTRSSLIAEPISSTVATQSSHKGDTAKLHSATIPKIAPQTATASVIEAPKVFPAWSVETDTTGPLVQIALGKDTLRFRRLPKGFFRLGATAPPNLRDKPILTPVTITKSIWLAQSEVTQGLWENVMGTNPSAHTNRESPVESVSFKDIQRFITLLESRLPGIKVRLPTEAEWEYGAACGQDSFDSDQAAEREWHRISVRRQGTGDFPQPRERRPANLWGLYDMLGNVREWTIDFWSIPDGEPRLDPMVVQGGTNRVVKGGCYVDRAEDCAPWKRSQVDSEGASEKIGFRLVLLAPMTGKTLPKAAK